jgi:hypothetical protein
MKTRFTVKGIKCASAKGAKCTYFSRPQAAELFSIFMGSVCLMYGLSQSLARECVTELSQHGQQVEMREMK